MKTAAALRPDISIVYAADLAERPTPSRNASEEKGALLELAARMGEAPAEMLPKFVELAMELTGATSAGISLLEATADAPVFRWHHLLGVLARFEGATTPRGFSPCGVTLDRREPTLAVHPERVYDWIPSELSLPEVLLVPLYVGGKEPLGTLWMVADKPGYFHRGHAATMQELATFIGIALKMIRAEEELHHALEQQELLAQEMSHRLKNVFAIFDGMIRLSSRGAADKEELVAVLSGRLRSLAVAHSLVRRSFSDVQGGVSELAELFRTVVEPHDERKFTISGPTVLCAEQAINGLALVSHELATNAVKYGVLDTEDGGVDIRWTVDGETLHIYWIERGGSEIKAAPESKGFGTTLVDATITRQLGGSVRHEWHQEGLTVEIDIPIARLAS